MTHRQFQICPLTCAESCLDTQKSLAVARGSRMQPRARGSETGRQRRARAYAWDELTLLQKPSSPAAPAPAAGSSTRPLRQLDPPACDGGGSSNQECCRQETCVGREGEHGHVYNRSFSWHAPERQNMPVAPAANS